METGTLQGAVACQSTQSGELYVQSENVSKIHLESSKGRLLSLDLWSIHMHPHVLTEVSVLQLCNSKETHRGLH